MPKNVELQLEEGTQKQLTYPMVKLTQYYFKASYLEKHLECREPKLSRLFEDLRHLALYLAIMGPDVRLCEEWFQRASLWPFGKSDLQTIRALIKKYNLTWFEDRDKYIVLNQGKISLYHLALEYPQIFMDTAARTNPINIHTRRFWYCAGNAEFWNKHSHPGRVRTGNTKPKVFSIPNMILSDILEVLLLPDESKLITLCALRATVRQEGSLIHVDSYGKLKYWILRNVRENICGTELGETRQDLRSRYKIAEIEAELNPIKATEFVYWWNLTSLREPDAGSTKLPSIASPKIV